MKRINIVFKFLTLLVAITICYALNTTTHSLAQERQVKVFLDGNEIHFDVLPMIIDGYTYVPMRAIFEAHGAIVSWDDENKVVTATRDVLNIVYPVYGSAMYVNDEKILLEKKGLIVSSRTLVPLRLVSEALGSVVRWVEENYSVYITSIVHDQLVEDQIIDEVAENKIQNKTKIEGKKRIMLSGPRRSGTASWNNNFRIEVVHYGTEDNLLYSYMHFNNSFSEQDIHISLAPSDKKIIRIIDKEKDPMPTMNTRDCSEMSYSSYIEPGGRVYSIPDFSQNLDCVNSNKAQKDAFEKWRLENTGITRSDSEGNEIVSVRRYVEDHEGALQDLLIKANTSETIIIVASISDEDRLFIEGSYILESDNDNTLEFQLKYSIDSDIDLGSYQLFYLWPF